jgi:single-stranded-DNA-specific exonuclease
MGDLRKLINGAREVADFVEDNDQFVVVGHYDADGLSATGLMNLALEKLGKRYGYINTKQLDSDRIRAVKACKGEHYLFVDFGSGQLDILEDAFDSFAVCDHHETLGTTDKPHFNAHMVGVNGNDEVSGAGCTYALSRALLGKDAMELSALAVVGAVGDMQDAKHGRLVGTNSELVDEGVKANVVERKEDIRLFGRHSRPLVQFLLYASDPIFPGLTANEEGVKAFLKELCLPAGPGVYYVDLDEEQKRKLISGLYVYGVREEIPEYLLNNLTGEVYELRSEENKSFVKDARDFSTLLNACGRHDRADIGVGICMGDREKGYKSAVYLLQVHRRMLREGIEWAQEKGVKSMKNIYVLDAGTAIKDSLIGVIAGMLYGAKTIEQDKPVIALSIDENGKLKVSGRATWGMVRKGLHLGKALKASAERFGGEGGGHNIAAGARLAPEDKEGFLEYLDGVVGRQLG